MKPWLVSFNCQLIGRRPYGFNAIKYVKGPSRRQTPQVNTGLPEVATRGGAEMRENGISS